MRDAGHYSLRSRCSPNAVFALAVLFAVGFTASRHNAIADSSSSDIFSNKLFGLAARMSPGAKSDNGSLELSLDEAMWTALAFEDVDKLRDLLKRGARPNQAESLTQMTPLMAAETVSVTQILLAAGADPNQRDRLGRTALHHGVKAREAASIVRVLGQAGADVNARAQDIGQGTPLLIAVEHYLDREDRTETALAIRILVHLGADIDAMDAAGRSALAIAASNNQADLIRLLIQLGADPSRELGDGRTPIDYARAANADDAIQALKNTPLAIPRPN